MTAVDLRELAVDRTGGSSGTRRPRRSILRYLVPACILAAFLALLGWAFRDTWLKATPVTVVPVLALRAEMQATDTPLFRSAGWIEPRPTPVVVSSLIDGIVERLCVIEGQEVKAGEPVAMLIRTDAEITVRQAKAELELQRSGLASANAKLTAAEAYLAEPIERISIVAAAESELVKADSMCKRIPSMLQAAQSRVDQAQKEFDSKSKAGQAVSAISVAKAESELAIAKAGIEELTIQQETSVKEVEALRERWVALRRQLELKIEEQRQYAESQAAVDAAKAQVELADAKLAAAELYLSRTTVPAPISGRVLALAAQPGTKLMGLAPGALQDASTLVTMYDPHSLQVRADVRLENVPQVLPGQKVEVATPAFGGKVMGHVLAITSTTDIQKNTLQVKVALDDPPAVLKPDMLVEALFLAPPVVAVEGASPPLRLMIPRDLIDSSAEEPMVWIADRQSLTARRRIVTVGSASLGDLVQITSGLNVGDRVIASGREQMQDGLRIEVRSEASGGSALPPSHEQVDSAPSRLQ